MLLFNITKKEIEEDLHKIIIYDCKEFYKSVYNSFSASGLYGKAFIVMKDIGYIEDDRERFKKIVSEEIHVMPKCCFEGGNYESILKELDEIDNYYGCYTFIKRHEDLIPYLFISENIIKKAYEYTLKNLEEEANTLSFNEFKGIFKENLYDCIHSVSWRK